MRYRMELIEDDLIVRNVETEIKLGSVVPHWIDDPNKPNRLIISGCTVLNKDADSIATIGTRTVPNPLEMASVAIANHEEHNGYPGFKVGAKNPDTHRIEWLLGTVLADAVSALARAGIEWGNGCVKAETKEKCVELLVQLQRIWYASRFGSFDAERGVIDPYFANGSCPRMAFAAAAQHYGMAELRMRFPDVSETTQKEALSWPLDLLRDTLIREPCRLRKAICGTESQEAYQHV